MKKKLLVMLMAGMVAVSACACGKKAEDAANATEGTTVAATEETAQTQESEPRVSERPDYVGYEELAIEEYITLPDYASMTVQAQKPEVTDTEIEEYINSNLLSYYPVTDRAVQSGDLTVIDFTGKKDGVAFEGGTAEGYSLEIGSGAFIDEFESGLIGVELGETVDLNLTFPENYSATDLAGADVVFTVTVHEIKAPGKYQDVTPEMLTLMGSQYTSKEELWEEASKVVEENAQATFENNAMNAIAQKLVDESVYISLPEVLVDEVVQNQKIRLNYNCMMYMGTDLETYVTTGLGKTMEEFEQELRPNCEMSVKYYLAIEAIARAEGIEMTDEMIMEAAAEEATSIGYESADALLQEAGKSTYRMYLVEEKVMNQLKDMVTIEPITAEEAAALAVEQATETETVTE